MSSKLVVKSWTWHLKAPREALWPLLSDTARLNEAMKLPRYSLRETVTGEGLRKWYGEYDTSKGRVRWEEPPFEWARNHWWRWERFPEAGPFERVRGTLVMEPGKKGGTEATYTLEAEPRNMLGHALIRTGHFREAAKSFERILRQADSHCRKPMGDFHSNLAAARTGAAGRRESAFSVPSEVTGADRALLTQIFAWLALAPDADVAAIRPKRMARALGIGLGEAHTACIVAAKIDALEGVYRIVCSSCHRDAKEHGSSSGLLDPIGCRHCGAIIVPDLAESVEVIFRPHAALRSLPPGSFCASGPANFPRIILQQTLEPHERRNLPMALRPGGYTARMLGEMITLPFEIEAEQGALIQYGDTWIKGPVEAESVMVENHGERPVTVVLETQDWPVESTSAAELLTYQRVREVLSPGLSTLPDASNGGTVVLAAVNARSEQLGEILRKAAIAHDGAVVEKTNSGTILVFGNPRSAVTAMDAVLQRLTNARIGVDIGPVTLYGVGEDLVYDGAVRERVEELAGLAQEGIPNLSPAFKAALKI